MKRKGLFLLLGLLSLFLIFSCAPKMATEVVFRIGNGSEPQSLDPALITGSVEHKIYQALFEGLMDYDPQTNDPVPALAESYTISDDGLVYTFKLRNSKWTDGTKVTAQQIVDSWLRVLDPKTASEYAYMMTMVVKGAAEYNAGKSGPEMVKVKALDEKTFQFELVGPTPYALGMLAHYTFAVVPMHIIQKFGADWTKPGNMVSNGPFKLESWKPQETLTVVKNKDYWDAKNVKLDKIIFYPIDDNNTAYKMYKNGELDWQEQVPLDMLDEAKLRPDYQLAPAMIVYYYSLNTLKKPLDDVRVRKALSLSINRKDLVDKVTRQDQIPAYNIVPPMSGYAKNDTFSEDKALAKQLLADAGYPDGRGFPKMDILYNTSEGHKKIAEYIQQQWKEALNIDIAPANQEWQTYLSSQHSGNFTISRAAWQGDYKDPNTFLDMFISTSGNNFGSYNNPEYDRLIAQASQMKGGAERFKVLKDADTRLIGTDAAVIPLYFYTRGNMIDTTIWGGWYSNILDVHSLKHIYKIEKSAK